MPIYNSQLLLHLVANGFQIGFSHATHTCTCTPAKKNHSSADDHPSVISEGLANEVQKGGTSAAATGHCGLRPLYDRVHCLPGH